MPLAEMLADHVAELALVDALEVRPWREVSTPAQEHTRAERQREATRQALAIIDRERRGVSERPPFSGPLQALRALDEWRLDGPSIPGTPVWSLLDEHDTGRGERPSSCVERLADVAAAWESCLADGWTITTTPALVELSAPQARAVVVWATLGVGALAPLQQDRRGLTREAWRTERQSRRKLAFRGGFELPENGGAWSRYREPLAPAIAEYASGVFGVEVPVGHVARMRALGVGEFYRRMQRCGLVPRSERMEAMGENDRAWDLSGWAEIAAFLGWAQRTAMRYADRAEHPLPVSRVGDRIVAVRAEVAAWTREEVIRGKR